MNFEVCKQEIRSTAFIEIIMATKTVKVVEQDVRVTFAGTLSNLGKNIADSRFLALFSGVILILGGTFGLFTGMSLLSLIEILFWSYRCVSQMFGKLIGRKMRGPRDHKT